MRAKEFVMMIGPAGCGKSTIAEKLRTGSGFAIVSSDAVRWELFGDESVQLDHKRVFEICHDRILRFLRMHGRVVFDATNLKPDFRVELLDKVRREYSNSNIELVNVGLVYDGDLSRCLQGNMQQDRNVPEAVVRSQYQSFEDAEPVLSEGFDLLVGFKSFELLMR